MRQMTEETRPPRQSATMGSGRQAMCRILQTLLLLLVAARYCAAAQVTIKANATSPQINFALQKLDAILRKQGDTLVRLDAGAASPASLVIAVEAGAGLGPEDFVLARNGGSLYLRSIDPRGAMYGLLELGEELRLGTPLDRVRERTVHARLPFRAIKFNLPFAAYRTSPGIELHQETCKDEKFWETYLDMMAENRFNVLTLWSMHPFHYMTVPKGFPEAQTFSDPEMAQWRKLWTAVFRMAKERGIETYLINWNTFVSPAFAKAHGMAEYSIDWKFIGEGAKDKLIQDYTHQCVTQVIDEYPDLTGLGITLGERMGGQTPDERRDWLEPTFFQGIAAAKRPVKFIYRAPLSADTRSGGTTSAENDRKTRNQIETLKNNITTPILVEFKFNWSHGHSSPTLFHVHGGTLSDAYWNPKPTNYRIVWTVRNEDFYVLRWGESNFIREFIRNNGHDYVQGAIIGSENFLQAKEYVTRDGPHKTWDYAFQRQWLFWTVWGRLLYDPATPDAVFASLLGERFGTERGNDLLTAWTLASRTPLRFASFHKGTWDGPLYTESFGGWADIGPVKLFEIDPFISHPVLDPKYINIADFVKAGGKAGDARISPLQLADELDRGADQVTTLLAAIRARGDVSPTLDCELMDIEAWNAYARYFALKLRGGVALATFRMTGNAAEQQKAVAALEDAARQWRLLCLATTKYNHREITFHTNAPFSWESLLPAVMKDIETAKNAKP